MEHAALYRALKDGLVDLYSKRLVTVLLYGSQARGDATEDSDVDILIALREPFERSTEMKRTSRLVAGLSLRYGVLLSRVFVGESEMVDPDPLSRNARREGIDLLASPDPLRNSAGGAIEKRDLGFVEGTVPDEFFDPLPDSELDLWE